MALLSRSLGPSEIKSTLLGSQVRNNRNRDASVNLLLKREKWKVLRYWEHDVERDCQKVALAIAKAVTAKKKNAGR